MSHACNRFWKCRKTLTFCELLTRCTIPSACHAKQHLNVKKWSVHVVFLTCLLRHVLRSTTACTFLTSQLPKVVRTWCVLYILTSKCALRRNGVHFFDSAAAKSAPNLSVFLHFWLGNVLRATTACKFSSLIWPAGSAPAALASLLFSTLRSHTSFEKHTVLRLSYLFAHLDLLSSEVFSFLIFFLLLFSSLLFSSLLFSDSSHLCFLSVHIVGSLTSKLPLISDICQLIEKQNLCR